MSGSQTSRRDTSASSGPSLMAASQRRTTSTFSRDIARAVSRRDGRQATRLSLSAVMHLLDDRGPGSRVNRLNHSVDESEFVDIVGVVAYVVRLRRRVRPGDLVGLEDERDSPFAAFHPSSFGS